MDEKDPNEEELNPQGQDDLNDADDSFGLPDLEYKPLDEEETTEEPAQEPVDEPEDTETTTQEDSYESQQEDSYTNPDEEEESENEEKPALRYQLDEDESSSNAPKIILFSILAILIIGAGVWYLGFYKPKQEALAEEAQQKQEQLDKKKQEEAAALKRKQEEARLKAAEEARLQAEAEARAKAGVQILTERTGRYYIVLESFIDEDFAKDFGNKIAQEGTPSFLIPPYAKKKMQRVGIGGYETLDEAQTALNDLPEEFGNGKWIVKY